MILHEEPGLSSLATISLKRTKSSIQCLQLPDMVIHDHTWSPELPNKGAFGAGLAHESTSICAVSTYITVDPPGYR